MNKEEMTKIVNAYAKAKHEEKTLKASIADMADAIKDYFGKRNIAEFVTDEATAKIGTRESKSLDTAKLAAHFGGTIPEKFYTTSTTAVLTVKAAKKSGAVEKAISAA